MKKLILITLFFIGGFVMPFASEAKVELIPLGDSSVLSPEPIHSKKIMLILGIISNYHYRKLTLDDSLSSAIFDAYIQNLDNGKLYFQEEDIKDFEKYRYRLDSDMKAGDVSFAYVAFNVFRKRAKERIQYVVQSLSKNHDFTIDEDYETNRQKATWAKNTNELNEIWDKAIKSQMLNLKLTGQSLAQIQEVLKGRYERYQTNLNQSKSEDVFETFTNAVLTSYDPHSNYFSPISSDNFNIQMKNSLEGIGAVLRSENDFTKIVEIRAGSPAFKSKMLNKDDKIIAVAQGKDGKFVDVVGWRLDDVVQLIRGPKGTVVKLQIIPANTAADIPAVEVVMVREKITFEEQSAKKEIITYNKDGKDYKIGVIQIPSFYFDFEAYQKGEKDYKSTTRDVTRLLDSLKAENIDGLVIDLRDNGGGSLKEAIDLTGLFITSGAVVQVRNGDGSIEENQDKDSRQIYGGPMTVLVNRLSASASEIFAGAIQDYQRGVIVGEQTYGKGTVQNIVDLNRFSKNPDEKFGHMNLTLAKFYRITGSSTQHRGVIPDIELPSPYDKTKIGESAELSALPWDEIKAAKYTPYTDVSKELIAMLKKNYQERLVKDNHLKQLISDIEEIKKESAVTLVSLQEEKRKKELEDFEKRKEERKKNEESDLSANKKIKDHYIENGAGILVEMILNTKK